MIRIFIFCALCTMALTTFAETCPDVSEIFRYDNTGHVVPVDPPGWLILPRGDKSRPPNKMQYASWSEHRDDTSDNNRIMCWYGNYDTTTWGVKSLKHVDKTQVVNHREWKKIGDDPYSWYFCERTNPQACPFG